MTGTPQPRSPVQRRSIFLATRAHGLPMCLAIADRLGVPVADRVLVTADTSDDYESRPSFPETQRNDIVGFAEVIDWNRLVWPARAHGWNCDPFSAEARMVASALGAGDGPIRLIVESLQVPPAAALVQAVADAEVHVYADGLMTYGGRRLPLELSARVTAVHYRDLLPPLRPRVVDHRDVAYEPYGLAAVEAFGTPGSGPRPAGRTAVVLQQYLAGLGLITPAEESALMDRMIAAALADGADHVLVKAHPAQQGTATRGRADTRVESWLGTASLEGWLVGLDAAGRAAVSVYSCFSTGLLSARRLGVRAVAVGTDLLLDRLSPGNGNYVPVVVCDSVCETVPATGTATVRPPRTDEAGLDLALELLAYLNDPYAHWRTRQELSVRYWSASDEVRDYLHRYLRRTKIRSHGLFPVADEPNRFRPGAAVAEAGPGRADRASVRRTGPALSVIVPVRNASGLAAGLAASIAANASADIEWLLIDEGSTDDTAARMAAIGTRQPGVRLIRHSGGRGASAARNSGIRAATGTWLTFMDANDWLAPGYLGRLRDQASASGVDLIRVGYVEVDGSTAALQLQPVPRRDVPLAPRELILPADQRTAVDLPQPWLNTCSREFVLAEGLFFDESLETDEDREWTWRAFLSADAVVASSTIGYHWRRGHSSALPRIGDVRPSHYRLALEKVAGLVGNDRDRVFLPKVHRTLISIGSLELERCTRLAPSVQRQAVRELRAAVRAIAEPDLVLATMRLPKSQRRMVDLLLGRMSARKLLAELSEG